jgi:cytochrome c-type biogenesis protein CcmH/NrfF
MFDVASYHATIQMDPKMEVTMPVLLWLLGVPLVVVVALMLTHVI